MQSEKIEFTEKELKVIAMALSAQGDKSYGTTNWFLDMRNDNDALVIAFKKVTDSLGGF